MTNKGERRGGRVEPEWKRNAEVCHELWLAGIDPYTIEEGGLTTVGYFAVGEFPEQGEVVYRQEEKIRTFIKWPNEELADRVLVAAKNEFMKKYRGEN